MDVTNHLYATGDTVILGTTTIILGLTPGSANHTSAALGHRCDRILCRRFDIIPTTTDQRLPHTAWECQLTPTTIHVTHTPEIDHQLRDQLAERMVR